MRAMNTTFRYLIFIGAMIGMTVPAYSQSSTDAPTPPAAQAPAGDSPPPGPSAETLKRAKAVGLRPEVRKGVTVYCWEDADTGTRFKTKKCVDENRLAEMIQQREAQRDQLRGNCGGGGCNR
jgi:hypothetical protein